MPPTADVNALLETMVHEAASLSASDLVDRFGLPVREYAEAWHRPEQPATGDSLRTLVYHGLEFSVLEQRSPASASLSGMALTDARYTSPEGLRVGFAESQVLSLLGRPSLEEDMRYVYERTPTRPFDLVLVMERSTIERIEWHFQ